MRGAVLTACVLLAACGPSREEQEEAAQAQMVPVVTQIIAPEYPRASLLPLAECVAENASEEETFQILQAALQGVNGRTAQMVLGMARRPEVRACAFDAGATGL